MLTALAGFAAAATLLILAPGPDTMLVMRNALRGGHRVGLCTAAGTMTGLLSWAVAAALGLSSLLAASRLGYDVLRLVGAAYLIWLGVTSLWPRNTKDVRHVDGGDHKRERASTAPARLARAYLNGMISNVCNPKIGVFFVAFLPGFIPAGVSVRDFSFLLGVWFALETGVWLAVIIWMVVRGVGWLGRPRMRRRLERLSGVVLIGFGVRLATGPR